MRKVWFDADVAARIGLNEALLLNYIAYWCWKNKEDESHLRDGKTWMYVTFSKLYEMFPFFAKNTVQRTIYELQKRGYILICHHGDGMNRTNWYALTDSGKQLVNMQEILENQPFPQNGETISPDMGNQSPQNGEMHFPKNDFPTNYKKKDIQRKTQRKSNARAKLAPPFDDPPQELIDAWNGFVEMRKSMRKPLTERSIKLITNKLEKLAPGNDLMKADILDQSVERGWQSVFELKVDKPRKSDTPYNAQPAAEEMYQEGLEIMKRSGMI